MNELLEIHLTKPAARGHCVVWLDFDEASLGDVAYVHAGDVQYWQAAYGSELVEGDVDLLDSDLSELRPTEHHVVAPPRRDRVDPDTVWARVDLGKRLAAGAVQDAEEQALLLADLASVYVGGPRWIRARRVASRAARRPVGRRRWIRSVHAPTGPTASLRWTHGQRLADS